MKKKKKGRRKRPGQLTKRQQLALNIKESMRERRRLHQRLLTLLEKHEAVFEKHDTLKNEIETLEAQIKGYSRELFPTNAKAGIFTVHKDDFFKVLATVKYRSPSMDPAELAKKYPKAKKIPGVIVRESYVDLEALEAAVDEEKLPEDVYDLEEPGERMTTAVQIKELMDSSTVVED